MLAVAVLLLLFPCDSTFAQDATKSASSGRDGEDCVPAIADKCFSDVAQDYQCLLLARQSRSRGGRSVFSPTPAACVDRDSADFCMSLKDALNCTSDIIDGDCSAASGRLVFDGWLNGLRSARRLLCSGRMSRLETLMNSPGPCADQQLRFVPCMEREVGVTHVTDLLHARLDDTECRRILRAAVDCARRPVSSSFHLRLECLLGGSVTTDVLSDLVTAFLLESPCRGSAWLAADGASRQTVSPASTGSSGSSGSSGATAAIVLLACAALTLGGALLFFTHRTSCFRIPLSHRP